MMTKIENHEIEATLKRAKTFSRSLGTLETSIIGLRADVSQRSPSPGEWQSLLDLLDLWETTALSVFEHGRKLQSFLKMELAKNGK